MFGLLAHWSRLLCDRAGRLNVTARVACTAVLAGVETLINPAPIQVQAS